MKKQKDWFKDRGYPHFSNKTPLRIRKNIEKYVSKSANVSKHNFHPLLLKQLKQRRYKLSNHEGIKKRSHKKVKNGVIKSNIKIRNILYATHIDAHIYAYYAHKIIAPKYEQILKNNLSLSNSVTAYRQIKTADNTKYKNNIHFAKDVFDEIKRRGNCVVLAFDIENFFPSLDHKILKKLWYKVLNRKSLPKDHYNIYKSVTNFSYVRLEDLKTKNGHFDEKKLAKQRKNGRFTFFDNIQDLINSDLIIYKNQKRDYKKGNIGIPQGLPISALLANIYMLPFDEVIVNNLSTKNKVFYRRYSDDIIIICNEHEVKDVEKIVSNEIAKIKLTISKEKTEKTLFKNHNGRLQSFRIKDNILKENIPLNYLGFEFYGYQTLIKSKNLAQFYREMKSTIKRRHRRIEKLKEKHLLDEAPIFKNKIYRLFSYKGAKTRILPSKRTDYINGRMVSKTISRKFRGNYLRYIYFASDEMGAPEIKKQLRNHWKILRKTLKKYEFSNVD